MQIQKFEDYIRQYRVYEEGSWNPASIYIESIPGQNGLAGGNFFTLTYSLLGQASTIFLTYIIIIVQFESGSHVTSV